jgi:hypothetical protein
MTEQVTTEKCRKRHKRIWQVLGVVMALFSFVFIAYGIVCGMSTAAHNAARTVEKQLSVHEARQNGKLEAIELKLLMIERYQRELRADLATQHDMIEDLWKRNVQP